MKKIFLASVFIFLVVATSALTMAMSKRKTATKKLPYYGTIQNVPKGSDTYVIVPDNEPNKKLWVETLDNKFKKDGLKVVYIGIETAPAGNVRMKGTPYKLKMLQLKK